MKQFCSLKMDLLLKFRHFDLIPLRGYEALLAHWRQMTFKNDLLLKGR